MLDENDKKIINNVILNTILSDDFDDEVKIRRIERFEDLGGDVKAQLFGKSMLSWAKERNVGEGVIKYLEKRGVKEEAISKEEADEKAKGFWNKNGAIKNVEEIKKLVYEGANLGAIVDTVFFGYSNVFQCLEFEEINEVLKILPKGYVIDGDVKLSDKDLEELPDFSNVIVKGSFYCDGNQLTSLRGAPQKVGLNFSCVENKLTTLKGAPEKVGEDFACWENQLTSLEGGPSEVGGSFLCSVNKLTSLEGVPQKVGGNFNCNANNLTSLRGAPTEVGDSFLCDGNLLTSLRGGPKKVGDSFYCHNNNLTTLEGAPQKVGGNFVCSDNQLTSLEGAPEKVGGEFNCCENQLTSLDGAPEKVGGDFDCFWNESLESLKGKPLKIGGAFKCDDEVLERIEKNKKIEPNFGSLDNGR